MSERVTGISKNMPESFRPAYKEMNGIYKTHDASAHSLIDYVSNMKPPEMTEEQAAATNEISHNVQEAAAGTDHVTANIIDVATQPNS